MLREGMDLQAFLSWWLTSIIKRQITREWEVPPFCLLLTFSTTPLVYPITVTFAYVPCTFRSILTSTCASALPAYPSSTPPLQLVGGCVLATFSINRKEWSGPVCFVFFSVSRKVSAKLLILISADHSKDSVSLACPVLSVSLCSVSPYWVSGCNGRCAVRNPGMKCPYKNR